MAAASSPPPTPPPAYNPFPPAAQAPPAAPAPRASSKKLALALGLGALAVGGIVVAVVALRGGGQGLGSKDELARATLAAMAAGDVETLVGLADAEAVFDRAVDCSKRTEKEDDDEGGAKQAKKLRRGFEREAARTKGWSIELVELERGAGDVTHMKEGDKASKGCVVRKAVAMHRMTVAVKVTQGDKPARTGSAELRAIEFDGRWYLGEAPRIRAGVGCDAAVARMVKELRDKVPAAVAVRRCQADGWSDEALECMVDDDRVSTIDLCIKKLSQDHQTKLERETRSIVEGAARPTPVPDPPDPDPAPSSVTRGQLAAMGLPACEAYRELFGKLASCPTVSPALRDSYKRLAAQMDGMWKGINTRTSATMKQTLNDMCRKSLAQMKQVTDDSCL